MKPIKLSEKQLEELTLNFKKFLKDTKFKEIKNEFKFDLSPSNENKKKKIILTLEAYMKMRTLVEFSTVEIAWHGLVTRLDTDTFYISDIIMYPQYVTSATVTTDDEEYANWLQAHDDETFNKIRFQGHSHVNFGITPSGTDEALYGSILETLEDNDYYIFMITNKAGAIWINIYDFETNTIYEKDDIIIEVKLEDSNVTEWYTNQTATYIKEKPYAYGYKKTGVEKHSYEDNWYNWNNWRDSNYKDKKPYKKRGKIWQ